MKNYNRFVLYSMQPSVITGDKNSRTGILRLFARMVMRMFNRSG